MVVFLVSDALRNYRTSRIMSGIISLVANLRKWESCVA